MEKRFRVALTAEERQDLQKMASTGKCVPGTVAGR
jgi:hypothetical protein